MTRRLFSCRQCLYCSAYMGRHMHPRILHTLILTQFLCCQNKKEEIHARTTPHYFVVAKTAQTDTFSRSRSSLCLCQADNGQALPLDRLCVSKPRGDGGRLWSPPWLYHVTFIATSKLSSQKWPCFRAIFVNVLGTQPRATTNNDILSSHPRQPLRELLRAESQQGKYHWNYSPSGLLSE